MADSPASVKMEREDKESTAIPEEKADDAPSILPMTPESKQLAAVIATAVATAMAGKSASPDSSSSMVRYSATSSTAISTELAINAWWISLHVPSWYPPRYCQTLRHRYQTVFEQRLSAGIRVTSHHGILHDFHHQLLHPAPLMNSPSSSTCSHLLLVTSSHLDFPGGVMNRLASPVGVLAP